MIQATWARLTTIQSIRIPCQPQAIIFYTIICSAQISGHNTLFPFHIAATEWLSLTIASGRYHHATTAESADTCIGGLEGMNLLWI